MSQITYPSGRLVSYTRDTTGRITQVRTKKTASVTTWTTLVSSVTRRPMTDLVASLSYGNGLTESNTYTLDHELSRCRVLDGATALVDLQPLRADGLNITGLTDTVTPANSQTFGYRQRTG